MELQALKPINNVIKVQGKISYCYGSRACNLIKLKKDILNEFPQLRERQAKIIYKATFCTDYNSLQKEIKRLKTSQEALPILFFLYKEKPKIPN